MEPSILIVLQQLTSTARNNKPVGSCLRYSVIGPDLKRTVYQWEAVLYLSGFVGIFHSGGLLYVDFCCIHTSRLREERGENQKI